MITRKEKGRKIEGILISCGILVSIKSRLKAFFSSHNKIRQTRNRKKEKLAQNHRRRSEKCFATIEQNSFFFFVYISTLRFASFNSFLFCFCFSLYFSLCASFDRGVRWFVSHCYFYPVLCTGVQLNAFYFVCRFSSSFYSFASFIWNDLQHFTSFRSVDLPSYRRRRCWRCYANIANENIFERESSSVRARTAPFRIASCRLKVHAPESDLFAGRFVRRRRRATRLSIWKMCNRIFWIILWMRDQFFSLSHRFERRWEVQFRFDDRIFRSYF